MDKKLINVEVESLIIGFIFRKPKILNEYIELISSEYDFADEDLRFLYNLLIETYLNHDFITETAVNMEVSKLPEDRQRLYKTLGSFKIYQRLATISESKNDFKKIYNKLKTFNILRSLDLKGFAVKNNIDKFENRSVDEILKAYELQLMKLSTYIKGINDGERIGDGILDYYNNLKTAPDFGIDYPFPILSNLMRGLREKTIGGIGLNSGYGKSRMIVRMLTHTSILNSNPVMVIANEQGASEWYNMVLTSTVNNIFAKESGIYINEDEITRGSCTGIKDEIVVKAAKYIQDNSKIHFFETKIYDFSTLKTVMKKYMLRDGVRHFVVDTFKPYRNANSNNLQEWQQYTDTSEQLKAFAMESGINITFTFQLTDSVLQTGELNSNSISNAKHIYHNLDYVIIGRRLTANDKKKYRIKIQIPDNPFNGQVHEFQEMKEYYLFNLNKNRAGKSNINIVMEVDKGQVTFEELGFLVKPN